MHDEIHRVESGGAFGEEARSKDPLATGILSLFPSHFSPFEGGGVLRQTLGDYVEKNSWIHDRSSFNPALPFRIRP